MTAIEAEKAAPAEAETSIPKFVSPIADPLITGKLLSKGSKLLKKAQGAKMVKRGVPDVTKRVRKGQKGVVLLAADVFPMDLIAHLPILCEEHSVLYAFFPCRSELGNAVNSKRPVSVIFVPKPVDEDSVYASAYSSFTEGLEAVHPYMGKNQPTAEKRKAEDADEAEAPPKKKKKKSSSAEA